MRECEQTGFRQRLLQHFAAQGPRPPVPESRCSLIWENGNGSLGVVGMSCVPWRFRAVLYMSGPGNSYLSACDQSAEDQCFVPHARSRKHLQIKTKSSIARACPRSRE